MRFVDLTAFMYIEPYGTPVCAFFDTVTDRFVANRFGTHHFTEEEAAELPDRLRSLIPEGFWPCGIGAIPTCGDVRTAFDIAFAMGFLATREGYNGECAYPYLAPDGFLRDDTSVGERIESLTDDPEFMRLRTAAWETLRATTPRDSPGQQNQQEPG